MDIVLLGDFIHASLDRLIFIVDLVLKDLPLCLQICKLQVNLLKDIQFSISLKDGFLQVLDFCIRFFLFLPQLVNAILIVNETVNNWINQLLHKMPCLRLNIEPKKLEGRIVGRQALEVA